MGESTKSLFLNLYDMGGIPGLVEMGGNSCLRGCRFEFQHRTLDEHFFHN